MQAQQGLARRCCGVSRTVAQTGPPHLPGRPDRPVSATRASGGAGIDAVVATGAVEAADQVFELTHQVGRRWRTRPAASRDARFREARLRGVRLRDG
ncbi:hypothetical protein NKG94_12290 [Micromonospora sp. M12]